MASSSSINPHVTLEVGEQEYPYPSHVCAPNFVTLKLSGKDKYEVWKTQMVCLLKSHDMFGFVDGTLVSPQTSVSGKEKVGDRHTHRLWTRSDALVKGWILGSLSEQTLVYVLNHVTEKLHQQNADFSAKDVWDELQTIYAPEVLPQVRVVEDKQKEEEEEEKERGELHQRLHKATLAGDLNEVRKNLWSKKDAVIDKISNNGNTALHVAVGTSKKPKFLREMLRLTPENTQLLNVRNSDGSTLLHVAAIVGNTEAAKILVAKDADLLLATDNEARTPLLIALSNMHNETANYLLQHINTDKEKDVLFSGTSGDELLATVISSKNFGLAIELVERYKTLNSDAVLIAIAENFPSEVNVLEKYIGGHILPRRVDTFLQTGLGASLKCTERCLPSLCCWVILIIILLYFVIHWIVGLFMLIPMMLVRPLIKRRVRIHGNAMVLLDNICLLIKKSKQSRSYHHYYTNPIFEATQQNAYDVVHRIVHHFPNAVLSANADGHNIIQYAVINRSEKVYNILYQMSEHRNVYRTIKDSGGNNLLHLAARLAPPNKLNLISGAALQIQRELQWFKEVERFVCPLSITQKNSFDKTPQMVFTKEHKNLVIEGEKWMKATAESYTITAALIITIVFAAAITVPGGSNQDSGIPIFTNKTTFTIFAISDAISLFAAVTSLLMFLSILTTRFAEQDFLLKVPTKLIIGLATLFISTTAMIVAFGATLYLVFGQSNSRILIPIAVLTCLPITSFVTLQFPLIIDLVSTTYGPSIFGKKRDDDFY